MKKVKAGRIGRFIVCMAVLIAFGMLGNQGTFAWTKHEASQENNLQSKNISVKVDENFPDDSVAASQTKTKEVAFKNEGTAPVFVRMAYTERWETATELLPGATNVTKNWTAALGADWELKADGWYYYKKVLPAGVTTSKVLDSVTFPATVPTDADYHLDFLVETVQASDESSVNSSATNTVFGRTATFVTGTVTLQQGTVVAADVTWS